MQNLRVEQTATRRQTNTFSTEKYCLALGRHAFSWMGIRPIKTLNNLVLCRCVKFSVLSLTA